MGKLIASIKAVVTRLVFAGHGLIAIWQVTIFKKNVFLWYLSSPILLLFFEGVFTLTIKENQEWKWFCPSIFLYLASVVPAIWILELDKVDRRLKTREESINLTASAGVNLKDIHELIGTHLKIPEINLSTETWITLIEQFLMLILIIGRWMLPKGELTRDQLSQILLVYIGTAADIIEFFDSFKDDKVASEPMLVMLTLGIWTWSLMQFTVVLTATKSRKSRMSTTRSTVKQSSNFCNIDVWAIALNITLQDAPFLVFRLLIITHYKIISYMNVFFTCKNTLVILLQLYRLYVVHSENKKQLKKENLKLTSISVISKPDMYRGTGEIKNKPKRRKKNTNSNKKVENIVKRKFITDDDLSENDSDFQKHRKSQNCRKDTGYSTDSSRNSLRHSYKQSNQKQITLNNRDAKDRTKKHLAKQQKREAKSRNNKHHVIDEFTEETESDTATENIEVWAETSRINNKKANKDFSMSRSTISNSSIE